MKKSSSILITVLCLLFLSCSTIKTPPPGVDFESKEYHSEIAEFKYDLSYLTKDGDAAHDTHIFNKVYKNIDEAEEFLIIDIFLYNQIYDRNFGKFPEFTEQFSQKLIDKKRENEDFKIYLLTDENNRLYGSYDNPVFKKLEQNGIDVTMVEIYKLKDIYPWYSPIWRTFIEPQGNPIEKGWIPNFYGKQYPDMAIRNILRAVNVKADHRKIFTTEKSLILTSANIHDASFYNSNTSFEVNGNIINESIKNAKLVGEFSNKDIDVEPDYEYSDYEDSRYKVKMITELKVGEALDRDIKATRAGDKIQIGMYFLSDKEVIKHLIDAANRGVEIRMILDRNKDAFGMDTNGLPNKPVAKEIMKKTKNKVQIKWYFTNGEQFHTKYMKIEKKNGTVIINGGSSNFIRKNIRGFIMDANLRIITDAEAPINVEMNDYFERLWNNEDGIFTLNYEDEPTTGIFRDTLFHIERFTEIGSF